MWAKGGGVTTSEAQAALYPKVMQVEQAIEGEIAGSDTGAVPGLPGAPGVAASAGAVRASPVPLSRGGPPGARIGRGLLAPARRQSCSGGLSVNT